MAEQRSVLRWISWRDCCPWIMLFRAFSISITMRALLLATLGGVLVSLGWWIFGSMLFNEEALDADFGLRLTVDRNATLPGGAEPLIDGFDSPRDWQPQVDWNSGTPVISVWRRLSEPFVQWFNLDNGFRRLAYFFFGGLWTLVVWGFVGGALSRIGVVQLGREERVGLFASLGYARRYFLSYFGGPLFPLILITLASLPIFALGLIMRLDVGVFLGGLLWFLVIINGIVLAFLALGTFLGWPLMWGTISSEGSDAFDSLSRSFAYTFQRPLQYGFYVLVVALFGALCGILVSVFADLVENLTYWAVAWGAGAGRINSGTIAAVFTDGHDQGAMFSGGTHLIAFWIGCLRAVAACWGYAFFFISLSGVYLLVRRDVDQTEADEVYLEEGDEAYTLPPLTTDEAGVPKVADMPEEKPAAEGSSGDEKSGDETSDAEKPTVPPPLPDEPPSESQNSDT